MSGMKVEVEREQLKALIDIATGSMDYGSGFLDQEEVLTIRRLAVVVGIDPIMVTPSQLSKQWAHDYSPRMYSQWKPWSPGQTTYEYERLPSKELCAHCELEGDNPIHHGVDNVAKSEEVAAS